MELVRRYSNRLDLRDRLGQTLRRVQEEKDAPTEAASVSGRRSAVFKIKDRLSPEDIEAMVQAFRAGDATRQVLADQYGLSLSSVKNVLRQQRLGPVTRIR